MAAAKKTRKATSKKSAAFSQYEDMASNIQENMTQNMAKMAEGVEAVGEFTKANLDAVTESSATYTKGVEVIAQEQAAYAKSAMEAGIEQMQAMAGVKTPQQFLEMQASFMRSMFERNVEQASQVTEKMTTLAKQSATPLTERYAEIVEQAQTYRV